MKNLKKEGVIIYTDIPWVASLEEDEKKRKKGVKEKERICINFVTFNLVSLEKGENKI